jgi:uncharacterized protein
MGEIILQCPNCSDKMQLMQKYEAEIDYCPRCKGVWLDRGEIDKIASVQNRYEDAHYQKYHYGRREYDEDITMIIIIGVEGMVVFLTIYLILTN